MKARYSFKILRVDGNVEFVSGTTIFTNGSDQAIILDDAETVAVVFPPSSVVRCGQIIPREEAP